VLYGRDAERQAVLELLEAARDSRSGALVVRGEPGIGKSALLEDARQQAHDMHVLSARGIESESELPFAALDQLLRPALPLVEQLPLPQAAALRAALGLAEGSGHERFLVFAACLSLLSELAEERPVLCLVDDAHWLDDASADALRFVARRLNAEGIAIVFGAREGDTHVFEAADLPSLELGGLGADAAASLLSAGAGVDAAPGVRDTLLERTRGNALALVELPNALTQAQLAGHEPLPDVLPMTRQLEDVFLRRTQLLPDETQRVLLVAAVDDSEEVGVVTRAALELGLSGSALDAAEEAELVFVRNERKLEFRHPLVRSAVYEAASSTERRAAHAALAAALADEPHHADRRVWHLAACALQPDASVVKALEQAARRAEERNGHMAAAKALERAAELSVAAAERGDLLVRAATNLSLAGRDEQAVLVANYASQFAELPALRASLAHVRALAAIRRGRPHDVVPFLVEAADEIAASDPAKAIELLVDAADAVWQEGDRAAYLEITHRAAAIPLPPADDRSKVFVQSLRGFAAMIEGDTADGVRRLAEVAAWGARADDPRDVVWASFAAQWLGDATRFGGLVDRAVSLARERGELGILADTLGMRAGQHALGQRFDAASVAASEALQLARELKADNLNLYPNAALAVVSAVRGRDEQARALAEDVLRLATSNGLRMRASMAHYALALVELGRGRWAEALDQLEPLFEHGTDSLDPMVGPMISDKIEAASRAGRIETAAAALSEFETWVAYSRDAAAEPRLAACRAVLADGHEATSLYESALAMREDARPFDFARIRLLYGEHLRRERRRSDARVHLRAALQTFEHAGLQPWAERARAELRASGETTRARDPSTVSQLTPQELQVARLVSQGLANKEVAAQLFLSPRTVEAHLRSVYAKLEITSRTQLARLQLGGDELAAEAAVV